MNKAPDAFRTISEVAEWLDTPTYVLRFWESRFPQVKPVKRAGGRRYYRPEDMQLLGGIKKLLHFDGNTIKGVQNLIKEKGVKFVCDLSPGLDEQVTSPERSADADTKAELDSMAILKPDAPPAEPKSAEPAPAPLQLTDSDKATEQQAEPKPAEDAQPKVTVTVHKKTKIVRPDPEIPTGALSENDRDISGAADRPAADSSPAEPQQESAAARAVEPEAAPQPAGHAGYMLPGPFAIRPAGTYPAEALQDIETLYYSLKMVRNTMKRTARTG